MSLLFFREDLKKHDAGSCCYVNHMIFYVKRLGTKESKKELREISERIYGIFPKESEVDQNEIYANWLAHYGVVNWEEVYEEDEKEMRYSKESCIQLFLNKEYWLSLNAVLIAHAMNFENYLNERAMEDIEVIKKP